MFRITRKEEIFFDMFVATAESTCKAAGLLEEMLNNYVDVEKKVNAIEKVENDCDKLVHGISCGDLRVENATSIGTPILCTTVATLEKP